MESNKETFRIGGMTCEQCRSRIEKQLKNTPGILDAAVSFNNGTADITWNPSIVSPAVIKAAVEMLGYTVSGNRSKTPVQEIIGTLIIIFALYVLIHTVGTGAISAGFPLARTGMSYGMLLVIGILTSVHCIAMCGGINLSQCLSTEKKQKTRSIVLLPAILYNSGRVISYTTVGAIVGAIGSAITISGRFRGIVQLVAGVFMIIMGINMLDLFPFLRHFNPRIPKFFTKKMEQQKAENKSPLFIGLLNGLMPCGPLQAMQLYALSTGSPIAGGISMFLFSMGTVPLMFGLGALSSILSNTSRGRAFGHTIMKAGAILVTVMGMTMFGYGAGLSDLGSVFSKVNPFASKKAASETFTPIVKDGVQLVNSVLSPGRYPAITVQQGVPVRWTINAPAGSINGCNNRMIIHEYGIEHHFNPGENVIEFTPERAGKFFYTCWMGMIRSSITVAAEGETIADMQKSDSGPIPAGTAIPTGRVELAEIAAEGYQKITVNLRDDGIEPAIIVVQRGMPVLWTINNDSLDPGNSRLIFPAYYSKLDMKQGDNIVQLMPFEDFDFSTADNVFYGYVKAADDLGKVDIEAVKEEVAGFETLIYPETYFKAAPVMSCCN